MDKKKLGWIAALLAGGMMLAMLCLQTYAGNERAAADSRAALAATAAVDNHAPPTRQHIMTPPAVRRTRASKTNDNNKN